MTEKEAAYYLECFENWNNDDHWLANDTMKEFAECCVKAFEENRQYREIGTVEECQEAMEKQKPQKALIEAIYGYGEKKYQCPECGETLTGVDIFAGYCKWCGQAIIN